MTLDLDLYWLDDAKDECGKSIHKFHIKSVHTCLQIFISNKLKDDQLVQITMRENLLHLNQWKKFAISTLMGYFIKIKMRKIKS